MIEIVDLLFYKIELLKFFALKQKQNIMKKKSLKSLSLKKSNVAHIAGGLQDAQANQAQNAVSLLACPSPTIVLTLHTNLPMICVTRCCLSRCESWCVDC